MKKSEKLLTALFTVALGILFLVLKDKVISIAMTIFGVSLLISSIIEMFKKQITQGTVKLLIGLLVIIFGWTLISAALYIMAAALLISSVIQIFAISKVTKGFDLSYFEPIMNIIISICLLFNQGGAISWVFIVTGICFIIEGMITLVDSIKKESKQIE